MTDHVDIVCLRFGAVRRSDSHFGQMRHPQDGFHRGHRHPHHSSAGLFVADGVHRRLAGYHRSATQTGIADISRRSWLFLVLSGLATGGSWLCYFKALQLGDVNKVVPIDKSSTVLTILLAAIFLQEGISLPKGIGVALIAMGTFLMIEKKQSSGETKSAAWLWFALGSAVFASLTAILGKVGISGVESNLGTAIRTGVVLVMSWIMVFVTGKRGELKRVPRNELGFICLSGLATGGSWLCYYKALQDGPASVVVPIDKLSILVTIAFSYFVFHEKLTKKSALGLMLVVGGTLLMLV